MSKLLFDDDAGSDEETGFKTNKDFAKSYNKYRQKELLKKCKYFCVLIGKRNVGSLTLKNVFVL